MTENREELLLELRQIIQIDRDAADIIQEAEEMRKSMEKSTEAGKERILADAESRKVQMMETVKKEQMDALSASKNQINEQFLATQKALEDKMEKNRTAWVKAITERMTTI